MSLPQQKFYSEDEPCCTLCCGVTLLGDYISGNPCPGCGNPLPPMCDLCGELATCYGKYADHDEGYACDECCGHGCEDGHCDLLNHA